MLRARSVHLLSCCLRLSVWPLSASWSGSSDTGTLMSSSGSRSLTSSVTRSRSLPSTWTWLSLMSVQYTGWKSWIQSSVLETFNDILKLSLVLFHPLEWPDLGQSSSSSLLGTSICSRSLKTWQNLTNRVLQRFVIYYYKIKWTKWHYFQLNLSAFSMHF